MLIALMLACDPGETTFSNINSDVDEASGVAALTLSADELVFTDLQPDLAYSITLTLGSAGESNLLIYDVLIVEDDQAVFYLSAANSEDPSDELAPGTDADYVFTANLPEGVDSATARVRIKTNDPDWLDFYLPMSASALVDTSDTADTGAKGDTGKAAGGQ